MTAKEIMQLALGALENGKRVRAYSGGTKYQPDLENVAITALRSWLEEPEAVTEINFGNIADEPCRSPYCECDSVSPTHPGFYDGRDKPQPAREWVGLTDKEINCVVETSKNVEGSLVLPYGYARDIEAKLKAKNGIPEAYSLLYKAIEKEKKQPSQLARSLVAVETGRATIAGY